MRAHRDDRGQATIELVALLPAILVAAALVWQAVVAGQAVWLAGSAARAAARAHVVGADTTAAARRILPPSLRPGMRVQADDDGAVSVALAVPAVGGAWRLGTVRARARLAWRGS